MNKYDRGELLTALLFLAVFITEMLCRRYTFLQKEYFGLFLNTPDYWSELWSGPRPLITLAVDFLSQFYRFVWAGPAIMALCVTGIFLLVRIPLRRFQIPLAVLTAGAVLVMALLPESRMQERWAKVEFASIHRQWDKVIQTATPEAAQKDRVLIPYALLAHSERGTLPENIFRYPVAGPEDIDLEGELTRHGYLFAALQAECLGCTNEAIHNTFQTACTTTHGTSIGLLRQLIKLNIAAGNKAMAHKYATILAQSPLNAGTARTALRYIDALPETGTLDAGPSETAAIVSHNTSRNLRLMAREGYFNDAAAARFRCLLLLQRDLSNLAASFAPDENIASLPLCYQQALCLVSDPDIQSRLSPAVTSAFRQYMDAYGQRPVKNGGSILPGSFWDYYFLDGF